LARVPKEKWGISICSVDGQRFSIGDVHDKFTIQSTSKAITYSLTLEELGTDEVHKYQGREPSGRMFNEIVLDHNSKKRGAREFSEASSHSDFSKQVLRSEFSEASSQKRVLRSELSKLTLCLKASSLKANSLEASLSK
jgi:hypothetical protein